MDAKEKVSELQTEIAKFQAEVDTVSVLMKDFPDLQVHTNRWKTQRYTSKLVNTTVNEYEARHGCGCCSDSPFQIWPYKIIDGVRIYSDPPVFTVGEQKLDGYGNRSYPDWEKILREAGIPEAIIKRVSVHLDQEDDEED